MGGLWYPLLQEVQPFDWRDAGVGASIAAFMFLIWRYDNAQREKRESQKSEEGREKGKEREDRLLEIVARNATASERLARSMDRLRDWLEKSNGRRGKRMAKAIQARRRAR